MGANRMRVWVWGLGLVLFVGCRTEPVPDRAPPQLFVREPLAAASPSRGLGLDCLKHGGSICESGVCLHAGQPPLDRYVCSLRCESTDDCPREWSCVQFGGPLESYCVPSESWRNGVVPRGRSERSTRSQ